MALTVTQKNGYVEIECGGETVIVAGSVIWTTPSAAGTGSPAIPQPGRSVPPPLPGGPSTYLSIFAALPDMKLAHIDEPAFSHLIESDLFRDFATNLRHDCVISIQPANKVGPKLPRFVETDVENFGLLHHYLDLTK